MSKQQERGQRIYPKHPSEALFFWQMRQESILDAITEVSREFYDKHNTLPNLIFVNSLLMKHVDKEVEKRPKQLCIPTEDIIWFYSSPTAQRLLPECQYIIAAHTDMPGKSCSL